MPPSDTGETSEIFNPRPRLSNPEDIIYIDAGRESLNQYNITTVRVLYDCDTWSLTLMEVPRPNTSEEKKS